MKTVAEHERREEHDQQEQVHKESGAMGAHSRRVLLRERAAVGSCVCACVCVCGGVCGRVVRERWHEAGDEDVAGGAHLVRGAHANKGDEQEVQEWLPGQQHEHAVAVGGEQHVRRAQVQLHNPIQCNQKHKEKYAYNDTKIESRTRRLEARVLCMREARTSRLMRPNQANSGL